MLRKKETRVERHGAREALGLRCRDSRRLPYGTDEMTCHVLQAFVAVEAFQSANTIDAILSGLFGLTHGRAQNI